MQTEVTLDEQQPMLTTCSFALCLELSSGRELVKREEHGMVIRVLVHCSKPARETDCFKITLMNSNIGTSTENIVL